MLTAECKLLPRNVQEAVDLIGMASVWDFDARMQRIRLLAENPEVRVNYPKRVLYDAVEAASLYWHFVDVVWILLFSLLYLLPGKTPTT